jgi:hypothetical protein
VKEESQLEEMRAALRGERERAELARRRSSGNVDALPAPEPGPPIEPAPERRSEARPRRLRELFRRR